MAEPTPAPGHENDEAKAMEHYEKEHSDKFDDRVRSRATVAHLPSVAIPIAAC